MLGLDVLTKIGMICPALKMIEDFSFDEAYFEST